MSGSAGFFTKTKFFFLPRREPKGGRSGRWGNTKKNTATLRKVSMYFKNMDMV